MALVRRGRGFQIIDQNNVSTFATQYNDQKYDTHGNPVDHLYNVWTAVEANGAAHQMGVVGAGLESLDATAFHIDPTTFILTDTQGIRYTRTNQPNCAPGLGQATRIATDLLCVSPLREDPNGNQITFSANSGWTDTMGRAVPLPASTQDFSGCTGPLTVDLAQIWNLPGVNGGTYPVKFCYSTIPTMVGNNSVPGNYTVNVETLQSIVLPNGTAWTFQYSSQDHLANLTQIAFPTSGTLSYVWTDASCSANVSVPQTNPVVATRTVDPHDGTTPATWNYNYTCNRNANPGTETTVVTDPAGNDVVHTSTLLAGYFSSLYETQKQIYQGSHSSGTLLQTVNTDYSFFQLNQISPDAMSNMALNVVPIRTTTLWPNGQVSKTERSYDSGTTFTHPDTLINGVFPFIYGKLLSESEFDYGSRASGPLIRQTKTTYMAFSGPNAYTYLTNNLLSLPYTVQILNGSGTQMAFTQYNYDQTAPASSGVATQHDAAPPNGAYRGNLTTLQRWQNLPTSTFLSTTAKFLDTGTVNQVTDPIGHTTTTTYSSTFLGAYPTQTTNALGQSASRNYDFNTGQLLSTTDRNSQVTSYTYDSMWRPASVTYPDGGQTTNCYTDTGGPTCQKSGPPFSVVTTSKITSALNSVSTSVFDGFGRAVQRLNSDPDCASGDRTDTTYDALGRVHTVSNPYCTPSDPTYGLTTYVYDALGRTCLVVPPDGTLPSGNACPTTQPANTIFTTYSGSTTTVIDQAGKSRKSATDGLGRLTQVFEDPGSSNFETDYAYDALNNLVTVNQKGGDSNSADWRTRTFTYNSLSQLTQAVNPESATVNYTYDGVGNVLTKVSPAPNQTGSGVVTTCFGIWNGTTCDGTGYDALNRVTKKSFSDGTPTVKYGYDAVAPSGCTLPTLTINNGIGKRTGMCDAAGAEAWSYDITAGVGWKITDARATNSVTKTSVYQNNFDGSLASLTYPSGRVVNYAYNAAARARSAIDSTGPINYATAAAYAPTGALFSLTNGANLVSTQYFNNRLQPCRISVKNTGTAPATCTDATSGNVLDFTYNFVDASGHNNGNVTTITNNRDPTRSQTFTYDNLNRLFTAQTASTHATSPSNCWAETYTYDPWGNLYAFGANTTTQSTYIGCLQESGLAVTASTKNQLVGDCYDSAGNLVLNATCPGGAFTPTYNYDAENHLVSTAGVTYAYDGDGKRVWKAPSATPTQPNKLYWYGMGNDALDETDGSGSITNIGFKEYFFFGGRRIASRDSANNVNYYFADHLGTARIVANSSGTILDNSDFYPFGGERTATPPSSGNNYKFTGKERDSESNLDNFGARYDSSTLGRFMSPDPMMASARVWVPQTWNRYAYALNNPLRFVDPDGMKEVSAEDCKKDKNCVTVNVNVIYDQNANNGKGLTDKQKAEFEKNQLQKAKDEYGNADVYLNVTYTAGSVSSDQGKTTVSGLQAGALNVVVTDQISNAKSGVAGNTALSFIPANGAKTDDLPHEMAHQFMSDTWSVLARIVSKDPTGFAFAIDNLFTDITNDAARAVMNNVTPHLPKYPSGAPMTIFNPQARAFQNFITPQTQPK